MTSQPGSNPKRRFVDWRGAILPRVVGLLLERFTVGNTCDMRDCLVVLPGSLARRRLNELLAVRAQAVGKILYPPKTVTIGALPEQLYVAKYPFASDLVQHLAWVDALQNLAPEQLSHIVPVPPPKSASQQWLELGKMLSGLHRELASDCLDFQQVARSLGKHPEAPRWHALALVQHAYLALLDQLELWDVQTARLCALEYKEATTNQQIVVVGCVDLNRAQRGFLEAVSKSVELWIAAPESAADRFDALGCLESSAWQDYQLRLPSDVLLVGNSPKDQAELTAAVLAQWKDAFHVRDVTIGVADSSLIAELKRELSQCSISARHGAGTPLPESEPVRLLALIAKYIDTRSYSDFATLIRHPAVENLLRVTKTDVPADWLAHIDRYYQSALCKSIDGFVNEEIAGAEVFKQVTKVLQRWLTKLSARRQPISHWVQPLLAALGTAYERQSCDLDDPVDGPLYDAARRTCEAIVALRDIPTQLEPSQTVAELVDWLLRGMSHELVPEPNCEQAVEMLGWLELALDDAPALVVTGMHDGVVPESLNADAFLPNHLRKQLGMMDNSRRYARDMYALQVMLETRQELRIVVGKTDASGDPLVPSRLLMACPLEELPSRVLHLVKEDESDCLAPVPHRWQPSPDGSRLVVPKPQAVAPPTAITVTAFRDYLACRYRFYLRHVLKLRSEDDASAELDAAGFGVLLHDTLDAFGRGPLSSCSDAVQVREFLLESLHALALKKYGKHPPAAVLIQIEQAELRLEAFADKQAARAAEGWEIKYVEQGIAREEELLIGPAGKQLSLIGRIDRIDYHRQSKQWAIWDYKTSESAKNPVAVHWSKKQGWTDLQLPLYRSLAAKLGVSGTPSLGYISIPKQAADCGFFIANFSAAQLSEADAKAAEIAGRVVDGEFWPESIEAVAYDDFERICQIGAQRVRAAPPTRRLHRFQPLACNIDKSVLAQAERMCAAPPHTDIRLPPLIIRASAGTGKTFQLSNRLLQIILSGQEVDSILATTFTRKAAGEIMHRVLQRLAQACLDERSQQELASHMTGVDASTAACLAALRRVTASIHRLRIGTLDSFFAQLARTFSLEMALPPGWSAMDPLQEPKFQMETIGRMLDNHDRKTLVNLVRMLAKGESSRQVAEQVRQTVASGYAAYRATTEEAWDQLPLPTPPSEAATESALRTVETTKLGNKSADNMLVRLHLDGSSGNWEAVIGHGIYARLDEEPPTYYRKQLPPELVTALHELAARAAAELLPIRRNQTLASYQVLDAYDAQYTALARYYRALAFSDVTHYLSTWMDAQSGKSQSGPGKSQLEFRLDCGVQHLLLDEFQDTAPDQWRVLQPLATPLGGRSKPDHSFFCVGDTKQAIYGWRGGVAEIFDRVTQSLDGVQQQELRESFRSSPQVIDAVNEVFQNLSRHSNFADCDRVSKTWSSSFPEHRTTRQELAGYVRMQNTLKASHELSADENKEMLLAHAADQVAALSQHSRASIGVLFRTNADVGRMIGLLRQRGVSASQDGGNPLTDSVAVQLILSLVHLADHPGDRICAFHVRTSPLASQLPVALQGKPHDLAGWFRQLVSRRGLAAAIESIADTIADQLSWWDQHRVKQLIRSAEEFQQNYAGRLREFEESVMNDRVALPSDAQVKVMTVHKSKGLEFDAVFLPDLAVDMSAINSLLVLRGDDPCAPPDGVLRYMNARLQAMLPKNWQAAFAQHKQKGVIESLCLLYVAMTRARMALYMFTRPTGSGPTQEFGSLLQSTLLQSSSDQGAELISRPEAVLYESGDPEWYRAAHVGTTDQTSQAPAPAPEALEPLPIALRSDCDSAPVRGLRIAAPSSIHRVFEPVPLSSAFSVSRSLGATYGTLIHAFFEHVQWLDDFQFDPVQLRRIALATVTPDALRHIDISRVIDEFEDMLALASVRAALGRGRYAREHFGQLADAVEIDNERPISLVVDGRLISGTIDRLAVLMKAGRPYAAEIIDFKTDAFDPNLTLLWLDERIEHHRPQLEVYARVVSQLFHIPLERVATYLVMLSTDDFARCDHGHAPHPAHAPKRLAVELL